MLVINKKSIVRSTLYSLGVGLSIIFFFFLTLHREFSAFLIPQHLSGARHNYRLIVCHYRERSSRSRIIHAAHIHCIFMARTTGSLYARVPRAWIVNMRNRRFFAGDIRHASLLGKEQPERDRQWRESFA